MTMPDNTGTSRFQLNSFDEEGQMKIKKDILDLANEMISSKFLEFYRLFGGIGRDCDETIDRFLKKYLTKEDLYRKLKRLYVSDRSRFIAIMRDNEGGKNSENYCNMDHFIRQDRSEPPENLVAEVIYDIIRKIPTMDRLKFAREKIGIRNLEHRDTANVQVTTELKVLLLEYWWKKKGQQEQNSLSELKKKAKDGGYLKRQNDWEQYFARSNVNNQ